MLKLYINKCRQHYGGGMCVVAATGAYEAHVIMNAELDDFKSDNYQLDGWELVRGVTCHGEPRLLSENSYVE